MYLSDEQCQGGLGTRVLGVAGSPHLSIIPEERTVRVCQQLLQDRSREKVAVSDVDKFLTGLSQSVNVASQTICFRLPFSPCCFD